MKSSAQILSEVVGWRRDTLIRRIPAPDEWITINTNRSVIQPQGYATGGGIIRNSHGAKLAAFAANFGRCSIMRAELRAATLGLSLAWDMGFRQVNIQLDSIAAIAAIRGNPDPDGRHGHIIHKIRELYSRQWTVNLTIPTVKGTALRTCSPIWATRWLLEAILLMIVTRTFG
ncbi:Putative ribonuclease H protein At1g65750 [Linum perenne]